MHKKPSYLINYAYKNFLAVSNILKKSSLDKTNHQSRKKDHLKKNGKRETD